MSKNGVTQEPRVPLYPGDHLTVRVASEDERRSYGLTIVEPMVEIRRVNGDVEVHPARDIDLPSEITTTNGAGNNPGRGQRQR